MDRSPARPGPLSGIRVLDLTSFVLGPYATQIMGDMGADIVKIESLEGDPMRPVGESVTGEMGAIYLQLNRNKRSLSLDLRRPEGRETVLRLAETADVFVHNMRPSALERLGLAAAPVRARSPGILFCAMRGFGSAGPRHDDPAYDDIIQGASGIAALQSLRRGPPEFVAMAIADKVCGLTAAYAIAMGLIERQRSGLGQELEVPMFETMVSFSLVEHLWGRAHEPARDTTGYPRHLTPSRRPFQTADGYLCLMPNADKQWIGFFECAGRPELAADPRFSSLGASARNAAELYGLLDEIMPTRTAADWLRELKRLGIPCTTVSDPEDLLDDPHLGAVGFFREFDHPVEGRLRLMDVPTKFSDTPATIRRLPPMVGEHGAEILREAGFAEAEIDGLAAAGILKVRAAG